jgi:hypothetical protein
MLPVLMFGVEAWAAQELHEDALYSAAVRMSYLLS